MEFSALVMAGGRGSRIPGEKPLVRVGGISMLGRVVKALRNSKNIERVIVTSSSHTPRTADEAYKLGLDVLITPGNGYVEDMKYAVDALNLENVLVINSDLPFINTSIIDHVLRLFVKAKKPALTVMIPVSKWVEMGFEPTYTMQREGETLTPVGLNVMDGRQMGDGEMAQEVVVMSDALSFINVNSAADLKRAETFLRRILTQE